MPDADGAPTLFSFDYPPNDGGIARLCSEIASGLARAGVKLQVLSQLPPDGSRTPPPVGREIRVTSRRPWREFYAWRELLRLHGQGPVLCGIWYPEGLLALLAGLRPLVILAHGSELMPARAFWRRGLWRWLCRRVCQSADLVVANSGYTQRLVLRVAPRARVAAVPLGVDPLRFRPGDKESAKRRFGAEGRTVLSSVSRLHAYKGHDTVLRALAELPEAQRGRLLYLIAGKGPSEKELRKLAQALRLEDQVRFLGFVPEEDLPELYRASDLFVLCTREAAEQQEVEGFGLVFLEAQACGTPVVGTRTGGIPDAIREGEGGWLIEQDDAVRLAQILNRLAADPDEFRAAGLRARQRIERECAWSHYLDHLAAALTQAGVRLD